MLKKLIIILLFYFATNSPLLADPHPKGFQETTFNGSSAPVTEGNITTFQIFDRDCSKVKYGDGRGESDCLNGSVRNALNERRWRQLGETVTYSFSIWVDPSLTYAGWLDGDSQGFEPDAWNSHLILAYWQGQMLHNFLYLLKVDTRHGVSFLGRQCQSSKDFGEWVDFSMAIRWAKDDRGWIKVMCDNRIVYADETVATNQAPHCYDTNQCEPGVFKDPTKFQFEVGVQSSGRGGNWDDHGHKSPFIDIQDGGITIKMGNISAASGGELYTDEDRVIVMALQKELNDLGCDVGTADGLVGPRTREMTQTCRKFRSSTSPEKLTVATVRRYLELYKNEPRVLTPLHIETIERHSEYAGQAMDILSDFSGTASMGGQEPLQFGFRVISRYLPDEKDFRRLRLVLHGDLGKEPASMVGCRDTYVDRWDDGTSHAAINIRLLDGTYRKLADTECMLARLPPETRDSAEFVLYNFYDIVKSMSKDGSLGAIEHDGLRLLFDKIADGEWSIKLL